MFALERDSPRDQLVVTLFLLTLFGLLVGAGIKSRIEKAGINVDTRAAWDAARAGRRWWEVSLRDYSPSHVHIFHATFKAMLPARQTEFNLGTLPWSSSRDQGDYQELDTEERTRD